MAHACNPTYLEGRGQKDCGSMPVRASLRDPNLKTHYKTGLVEWLK
jgi:hypothetical protein